MCPHTAHSKYSHTTGCTAIHSAPHLSQSIRVTCHLPSYLPSGFMENQGVIKTEGCQRATTLADGPRRYGTAGTVCREKEIP